MVYESMFNQVFLAGFAMQLGLVTSLGMQNMYVIRRGLKREYPFIVALTCAICEFALLALGVWGSSTILKAMPSVQPYLVALASLFLVTYGLRNIYQGIRNKSQKNFSNDPDEVVKLMPILAAAVGFSLLNPQAIVEALIFYGGAAQKYKQAAPYFLAGAVSASIAWLFSLAAFSSYIMPQNPSARVWKSLDIGGGLFLISIGASLILL